MTHKKIIWLLCGNFNGYLDDGGTNSMLTLLRELQRLKAVCSVQVFFGAQSGTPEVYARKVKEFACNTRLSVQKDSLSFYIKDIFVEVHIVKENIFKLYHQPNNQVLSLLTLQIKTVLQRVQPDCVITHEEDIFSLRAANALDIPCCHIFSSACFSHRDTFRLYKSEFKAAMRKVFVAARSRSLKKVIRRRWGKAAMVLPAFIDYTSCVAKKRKPEYVTFVNYHPYKGAVIFWNIARKLPHKKFLLIDTSGLFRFESPMKNITVLSRQSDMKKVYRLTKILVFPSLREESYGRVIAEACANGIPVIANRIEGVKDTLRNAGFLVGVNRGDRNKQDYLFNPLYHMKTYQRYIRLITMLDSNNTMYNKASRAALRASKQLIYNQARALNDFAALLAKWPVPAWSKDTDMFI